jgi:hypothetical protein
MSDNSNGELRKVVCHASGDRCHACDHYYGRAESCEFKPTATSSDASELVKEILAETEHWDVMPECREKGDLELVIGLLKRCLPLLPSNERVSKKEAQLLVGALQEFHVLSDLGGDIEDHEVAEI